MMFLRRTFLQHRDHISQHLVKKSQLMAGRQLTESALTDVVVDYSEIS